MDRYRSIVSIDMGYLFPKSKFATIQHETIPPRLPKLERFVDRQEDSPTLSSKNRRCVAQSFIFTVENIHQHPVSDGIKRRFKDAEML